MRGPHPPSHVTLRYRGHVTNKKRYISTFTRSMDPKLAKVVSQDEGTPSTTSRDTSTMGSRDESKTLYTYFHKTYGPQTQRVGDFPVDTQSHMTLQYCSHVTNKKCYISIFIRPVDPKLGRVVTQDERTSPTNSRDTSTTWSRDK